VRPSVFTSLLLGAFLLAGCSGRREAPDASAPDSSPVRPGGTGTEPSNRAATAGAPLVVFLGDSLTAGNGLSVDQAFPAIAAEALARRGRPIRAVNAGVSGDTTAGGLRRADWVLLQRPDVVVLALGANDGLRGLPLAETERNLRAIVAKARSAGARVLLCGMLVPTSYGPEYQEGFGRLFPRVAEAEGVPFVPFLLEGVAGRPELNLEDGIHPNAEGQRIVAGNVLEHLEPLLGSPAPPAR
jgi:acyl-CoA thioesterase-1